MPEVPTPGVNGHVLSSPALQASMSISSLAPAARTFGWAWSTAMAGSFCLFWANGDGGLPTDTRVSPSSIAEAGTARATSTATSTAPRSSGAGRRIGPLLSRSHALRSRAGQCRAGAWGPTVSGNPTLSAARRFGQTDATPPPAWALDPATALAAETGGASPPAFQEGAEVGCGR